MTTKNPAKEIAELRRRRLALPDHVLTLGALAERLYKDRSSMSRIERGLTKRVSPLMLREWRKVIDKAEAQAEREQADADRIMTAGAGR